jgi:hypothetical protein
MIRDVVAVRPETPVNQAARILLGQRLPDRSVPYGLCTDW